MSETHTISEPPEISDATSAQLQQFSEVKEIYKELHTRYTKYKLLYEAIEDCTRHPELLNPKVKAKVQDILIGHNLAQANDLDSNHPSEEATCLLGVPLKMEELNHDESEQLQRAVKSVLQDKYTTICDNFQKLTGKNIEAVSPVGDSFGDFNLLSQEDVGFFDLKDQVEKERKKCVCNLLEMGQVLDDIMKLRLDDLPEVCKRKVEECETKLKMAELQCKIVQEKTTVEMFMKTGNTHKAYQEIMKDIKEQQQECQNDIRYLRRLKEKYEQVACKEFDEILKSYGQYKAAIEKKKMVRELLEG